MGFSFIRLLTFPEGFRGFDVSFTRLLAFPEGLYSLEVVSVRIQPLMDCDSGGT
jgi:hypothetical protein